jgi:hypothetical protein
MGTIGKFGKNSIYPKITLGKLLFKIKRLGSRKSN